MKTHLLASRALSLPPSGAQSTWHSVELAGFLPWLAFPLFLGSYFHPSSLGSSSDFQVLVSMYSQIPGFVSNAVNVYFPTTGQWVGTRAPGLPGHPTHGRGGKGCFLFALFSRFILYVCFAHIYICAPHVCLWRSEGGIKSPGIRVLHSYEPRWVLKC